jgi:hypothetical protein
MTDRKQIDQETTASHCTKKLAPKGVRRKKKKPQIFDLLSNFFVSKTAQQIIFLLLPTQILDCKADGRDTSWATIPRADRTGNSGLWGLGFRVQGLPIPKER